MNLNKELFLNRNFIIKRKPGNKSDYFKTIQKISYPNTNPAKNRYSKKNKDYFLDKINRINNHKIVNNLNTPSEKGYFTENNQSQVNRDIYGYNNYIINKNSFNTINFSGRKNSNQKISSINNFNYTDTPSYLTAYESSSDFNLNNVNNNQYFTNNSINNNNSLNNTDIKFMNMKLNFKILQQKLSHLNDIAISNDKDTFKTPYKISNNYINSSHYNTTNYEKKYPIKVFRSENINNYSKSKKTVKKRKDVNNKKVNDKNVILKNFNVMESYILKQNNNKFPLDVKDEKDLINIKIKNKRDKNYIKDRYYTNDNSFKKHYQKEESELSQLADNILEINRSSENFDNNYYIKDKSIDIPEIQPKNKNIIIKNQNKSNYKYISNELEEISLNKEYINKTQNNNDQNSKLIVEHIFSYNSFENKINITKENSDKKNDIIKNNNDRNINIVQTNNFIINNLTEQKKDKNEEKPVIKKTNTDIKLKKEKRDNKKINEKSFEDENVNENNEDDDGDKIINSLIATASQNFKKGEGNNININNSITDFDTHLKKATQKNVTFDDNLIYINYYQDFKVTNLHITDEDNKTINFRPKDISKYIKKLTNNKYNLKPIIINSNKPNYNNIINKIQIKNTNCKINKIKAIQTIKKNIDFIKEVQKRNNSKDKSQSKDKTRKKII